MLVEKHPLLFHFMVALTIVFAVFISIFPKPVILGLLYPELVCLFVIYWIFSVPQHIGISFAVVVGLFQDLMEHSIWGGHSIALAITAYICLTSYQRIISYSVWHQCLWIFVLVGIHQVVSSWMIGLMGYQTDLLSLLLPVVVTTLLWPVLTLLMRTLRRRFGVT